MLGTMIRCDKCGYTEPITDPHYEGGGPAPNWYSVVFDGQNAQTEFHLCIACARKFTAWLKEEKD